MNEAQAHRAARFDRDYTGSIQYAPLMDCKAYSMVREAYATAATISTGLKIDGLIATTWLTVTYSLKNLPTWRVAIVSGTGEVLSEQGFHALQEAQVVDRVEAILCEAGRA